MAGARTVEEILARGGADLFEITVFGDEPYGNYNRILLLERDGWLARTVAEIFLNRLDWYAENGMRLHAGARIDPYRPLREGGHRRRGGSPPYDKLIIATGSPPSSRRSMGCPAWRRLADAGIFGFRTLHDTEGDDRVG